MTEDRWTKRLNCPQCGKIGHADLWQEDGASFLRDSSTKIDSVSDGFRAIQGKDRMSVSFECIKCNILVK